MRALRAITLLAALVAPFFGAVASAGPRSINDCEAIKDPNAYNLCLASFGPVRGQHGATYPGVASEGDRSATKIDDKSAGVTASTKSRHGDAHGRWRGRYGGYRSHGSRAARGRVRMEFSPGQ